MMNHIFGARDTTLDFNVSSFYRLANTAYPNKTVSAGYNIGTGEINNTALGSYSSENWQLYYQSGRYFIRNYDFKGDKQLGLQDSNRDVPRLLPRSGALGQQWTVKKAVSGDGWTLSNGLLGEGSLLAVTAVNGPPTMVTNGQNTVWDIGINESAGSPKDAASYADVEGFVSPTSSSTSVSATATPSSISTSPSASTSTSTSTSSSTSTLSSSSPAASSSSTLSTGAIAGIAVGGALVVICAFLVFFLLRRRKRKTTKETAYAEVAANPTYVEAPTKVTYGYRQAEMESPRAELESPRAELGEGNVGAKHVHRAELG